MSDTLITIIAIFLAAVLMFVFPLMAVSNNQEDVTQLAVTEATQEFVNKAATKGKITQEDYDAYVQTLGATGNTYDIKLEVQHLDENPGKKTSTTSGDMIGENVRYSTFTDEILKSFNNDGNGTYSNSKQYKHNFSTIIKKLHVQSNRLRYISNRSKCFCFGCK